MENKLVLGQKIYDFLLYMYPIIAKFPKFEKFTLQTQIKNGIIDMYRCIIKVNKGYNRNSNINQAETLFEEIKMLIRLAHELRYIAPTQYETTSKKLDEIGGLLYGYSSYVHGS